MGFVELPDHRGLLYVPAPRPGPGKHDCPDCHLCQHCSNDRCARCRQDRRQPRPPAGGKEMGKDPPSRG